MNFKKKKKNILIKLNKNEQITFFLNKSNYDVAKKDWGYYVSPSLQSRCYKAGLKAVIIYNQKNFKFAFVQKKKINFFFNYLERKNYKVLSWIYRSTKFSKFFKKI